MRKTRANPGLEELRIQGKQRAGGGGGEAGEQLDDFLSTGFHAYLA